ncbi:NDUS5 protein, partial [Nesospiza acunhae]|nr:NDUS5 protein [Nesospiza acunhae]
MPFWGLQKQLGIDVDTFLLRQSMPQPHGQAAVCHAFEREWVECGHGLGQHRARGKGGQQDLPWGPPETSPCPWQTQRLRTILEQRDRMIKQGKYTPPEHHMGKEEPRP